MIRMYAMARRGELGERLFHYPIVGGSNTMLPTSGASHFVLYPVDSLYHAFGARPAHPMLPTTYLKALDGKTSSADRAGIALDYELCGLLIDRKLDDFVALFHGKPGGLFCLFCQSQAALEGACEHACGVCACAL